MKKGSFHYIKLDTDYLLDLKFLKLSDEAKWHYFGMYLLACKGDAGGLLQQNGELLGMEDIAMLLHVDPRVMKGSIAALVRVGLLTLDSVDDSYSIARYEDEQDYSLYGEGAKERKAKNAERQRKHRELAKNPKKSNSTELEIEQKRVETEIEVEKNKNQKRGNNVTSPHVTCDQSVTESDEFSSLGTEEQEDDSVSLEAEERQRILARAKEKFARDSSLTLLEYRILRENEEAQLPF